MAADPSQFVGDIPERYDRNLGPYIFAAYAADIAGRVAALKPRNTLEIAAGTGIVSRTLHDLLPEDAMLTVTDLNAPMLAVARRKFGSNEKVAFETADALSLPFADQTFDAVLCQFGVMFFPDKAQAFCEARRVLAFGGSFIFNVWDSRALNPFARIAHETVGEFFPNDPPQFYATPFSYFDIAEIRRRLNEVGFAGITIQPLKLEQDIDDVDAFAEGLVYGNPLIGEIRARGNVDPASIVTALADALRLEFGATALRMPLHAIVVEARNPVE